MTAGVRRDTAGPAPATCVVVTLDGQRVPGVSAGRWCEFTISPVDRGTHSLPAVVHDSQGKRGAVSPSADHLPRPPAFGAESSPSRTALTEATRRCARAQPGGAVAVESQLPSALSHFDPADLLDALSTGIVMLDAQLCPIYANVAAQDLLAFSLNQARGRPVRRFPPGLQRPDRNPAPLARDRRRHRGSRTRPAAARRAARSTRSSMSRSRRSKARSPARICCSSSPTPRSGSASRARTICWRGSTAAA